MGDGKIMYEAITLQEAKDWLNISDSTKDSFLETLRDISTKIVEKYIDKYLITRQITEYHNGEGGNKLMLKYYPVYLTLDSNNDPSNVTLHDDLDRDYTSSFLINAKNYWIEKETGKLELYNEEGAFESGIGNIRVTYWAGYSRFTLYDEVNNYIDINEGSGEKNIEFTAGEYNAEDLASHIQTILNASSDLADTYTVTYSHLTQKFTIASDGTFSILWNSGASTAKSIGSTMGFTTTADDASASSHVSNNAVTGIPDDFLLSLQQIVNRLYEDSVQGSSRMDIINKNLQQGGTLTYAKGLIPNLAKGILDRYKKVYL